jgi:hypothetical protein
MCDVVPNCCPSGPNAATSAHSSPRLGPLPATASFRNRSPPRDGMPSLTLGGGGNGVGNASSGSGGVAAAMRSPQPSPRASGGGAKFLLKQNPQLAAVDDLLAEADRVEREALAMAAQLRGEAANIEQDGQQRAAALRAVAASMLSEVRGTGDTVVLCRFGCSSPNARCLRHTRCRCD